MNIFVFIIYRFAFAQIVDPVSALVIVKMQNDFINGSVSLTGAPAKEDGADAIEPINLMLDTAPFKVVVYALDWLPANHIAFVDNVKNRKIHPSSKVCYYLITFALHKKILGQCEKKLFYWVHQDSKSQLCEANGHSSLSRKGWPAN